MCFKFVLLVLFSLLLQSAGVSAQAPYKFRKEIPIGGEGGWDILTIDPAAHRLYLSHATKVIVVDLEKNAVVGEIADTPGVHGFIAVPEVGRGFSSNGKEAKASVIDLKTLQTLTKLDTGESPDALVYESKHGEVYIFNHRGNSATVIDAKTAKVVSMISLGGSPEFAVTDSEAGRVYCNIEDKNEVAAIDTATHEVVARWPLAPGAGPSGIALDAAHHRLFSACDNKMMTMLDTGSGKVLANVPIGEGPDGCAFDDKAQLAFASCGDGTTTIAKEETPGKFAVVQTLKTAPRARTMALDQVTHRIYLPTAQFQQPPLGTTPQRPAIVPNTLKLLIYGPGESEKP
ncbi:MAG: YncE family protein [Chthoniobacterales bacterium]|jgi:YVTN family beta-propeller protein|nr:YncE family protein [Chthoniobacterales bacterium]